MTVGTRIQARRDTAANWTSNNPVLAAAELGWETDTRRAKMGDGTTAWNTLAYQLAGFRGRWTATTIYAAGDYVINPSGDIVSANAAHTSGSSYTATNWTSYAGATYVPQVGSVAAQTVVITRAIATADRSASKWREVFSGSMFQTNKPDPTYAFGWNPDGADAAEPRLSMGFEADYYDDATTRTFEWYVQVVRADHSGPQFRPFAFTASRDSNADLTASVQIDIGTGAGAVNRSQFQIVQGAATPIIRVTAAGVEITDVAAFRKSTNNVTMLQQKNAAGNGYIDIAYVDNGNLVNISSGGGTTQFGGKIQLKIAGVTAGTGMYHTGTSFFVRDETNAYDALELYHSGAGGLALTQFIAHCDLKVSGNVGFYGTQAAVKPTVSGSRGANAALASLLTGLASLGLLTDSSS